MPDVVDRGLISCSAMRACPSSLRLRCELRLGSEELDADAQYKKLYSWRRWYTGFFQGTTLLAVPLKSDHSARHPISVRLAFLREKDNEDKPTDKWDEHQ